MTSLCSSTSPFLHKTTFDANSLLLCTLFFQDYHHISSQNFRHFLPQLFPSQTFSSSLLFLLYPFPQPALPLVQVVVTHVCLFLTWSVILLHPTIHCPFFSLFQLPFPCPCSYFTLLWIASLNALYFPLPVCFQYSFFYSLPIFTSCFLLHSTLSVVNAHSFVFSWDLFSTNPLPITTR